MKIQSAGMPASSPDLTLVEGSVQTRRRVAGFTAPGPGGNRLMGVIALDHARRLLDYARLIGHPVEAVPASHALTA